MDTLRSAAHLAREIGDDAFAALVSSDNTDAVRAFANGLVKSSFPVQMTVGGRTYDILTFLHEGENVVAGTTMVSRAKKMDASLGQEDGEHLLAHQDGIPVALQGKVVFVFTDWRHPGDPGHVAFVYWDGGRWVQDGGLARQRLARPRPGPPPQVVGTRCLVSLALVLGHLVPR